MERTVAGRILIATCTGFPAIAMQRSWHTKSLGCSACLNVVWFGSALYNRLLNADVASWATMDHIRRLE
jgi:hypothetical protein